MISKFTKINFPGGLKGDSRYGYYSTPGLQWLEEFLPRIHDG
jgi:hypothetical protein